MFAGYTRILQLLLFCLPLAAKAVFAFLDHSLVFFRQLAEELLDAMQRVLGLLYLLLSVNLVCGYALPANEKRQAGGCQAPRQRRSW